MIDAIIAKIICKELEGNFPIEARPYRVMARRIGCDEKEFIKVIKRCKRVGLIKKIAVSLDYRRLGIKTHAMVVWIVPLKKIKKVAKVMSGFAEVTHCYQRPTLRHWPYNLFTMIHANVKKQCNEIAKRISQATGVRRYQLIYSIKELKKKRMNYFLNDEGICKIKEVF